MANIQRGERLEREHTWNHCYETVFVLQQPHSLSPLLAQHIMFCYSYYPSIAFFKSVFTY